MNLRVIDDERSMDRWRRMLADASVRQARRWSFIPPTAGADANNDYWVLRVPVVYSLDDPRSARRDHGRWEAYVPGPRLPNPWEQDKEGAAFSPDTLAPGRAYLAGSGLQLLTDPSGS